MMASPEQNRIKRACDRCGKSAAEFGTRWTHKDGRELILCRHHSGDHSPALIKQGWTDGPVEEPEPEAERGNDVICTVCKAWIPSAFVTAGKPGSVRVRVAICPRCDTRTCNHRTGGVSCSSVVHDRTATHCAFGHDLNQVK